MDLKFSEADVTFRQEVVTFLENEYPEDIKEKQDKRIPLEKEEIVRWQKILNQKGWFAINGLVNIQTKKNCPLHKNTFFKKSLQRPIHQQLYRLVWECAHLLFIHLEQMNKKRNFYLQYSIVTFGGVKDIPNQVQGLT